MSDTLTKTVASGQAWVTPISHGQRPVEGSRSATAQYNWTNQTVFQDDLSRLQLMGWETTIQTVVIDNTLNNIQSVTLTIPGTGQVITCPAGSQAIFPILMGAAAGLVTLSVAAPYAGVTRVAWLNYPLGASVWTFPAPASYAGPGDIVAGAAAWYGLRGYSKAVATPGSQKAVTVRRASDNATADFVILPSGDLDIASLTAFLAATAGFIVTWFDQSGNGANLTQATISAQPQITVVPIYGTRPTVVFNGNKALTAAIATVNAPLTMTVVGERYGTFTANNCFIGNNSFHPSIATQAAANGVTWSAGAALNGAMSDSNPHVMQGVENDPNSTISVDGTILATGTIGNANISGTLYVGEVLPSTWFLTGYISETGVWPVAFTPAQQTAFNANARSYWGF